MNPIGMATVQTAKGKINLQTLIAFIEMHPDENVEMGKWLKFNRCDETYAEAIQPTCGTVGCIAGFAYTLKMFHEHPDSLALDANFGNWSGNDGSVRECCRLSYQGIAVAQWLELAESDALALFFGEWTTAKSNRSKRNLGLSVFTKAQVVTELKYLLATGRV